MWVSILQNGRKKDKDNSVDKIKQYLKLTDKSSFSTAMSKSTIMSPSKIQDRFATNRQKENQNMSLAKISAKGKATGAINNILANRSNFFNPIISLQETDPGKKMIVKTTQQQNFTLIKHKKNQQSLVQDKCQNEKGLEEKKSGYFFRILHKKNKMRSQFNINIHNSIYTFKQFLRACQVAQPKPLDNRLPLQSENRKTIIFDMDETLIHTNQTATPNFQIKVPFRSFQGRVGYGFVQVRPHCRQILKNLSKHFDIVIFTASTQAYADPIIDHIDPDRVVQFRLYRQSCSLIKNQIFVKDLRVLGRKLSNVVLVDNAPYSYLMQLDNGIPILPYYKGKDDEELVHLENYLMKLKDVEDVRLINRDYFRLSEYVKYDSYEKIINRLYGEWLK